MRCEEEYIEGGGDGNNCDVWCDESYTEGGSGREGSRSAEVWCDESYTEGDCGREGSMNVGVWCDESYTGANEGRSTTGNIEVWCDVSYTIMNNEGGAHTDIGTGCSDDYTDNVDGQQEGISSMGVGMTEEIEDEGYIQQEVPLHMNNSADGTVTSWDRVVQYGEREAGGGQPSRSADRSICESSGPEALESRLESISENGGAFRPFVSGQHGRTSSGS